MPRVYGEIVETLAFFSPGRFARIAFVSEPTAQEALEKAYINFDQIHMLEPGKAGKGERSLAFRSLIRS